MAAELTPIAARGDFVAGCFQPVPPDRATGLITRVSPRDYDDEIGRFGFGESALDAAVGAARDAFPGWSQRPLAERSEWMLALKRALHARREALVRLITREVGKPLWEARTEVSAALNKIDITLNEGLALVAAREMGSPAQRYAFKPHGVCGVLGPFNFPLHLVHGHVVPALVTGNTVVVKPSELTPAVGQLYAECFEAAGLPAGVFNLVQGDASIGARLASHPDLDAVMLTGSYRAGRAIKAATLDQPHKLLALELGGHNPAIVLEDADLDKAVHDVIWGAFVSAGQRCSGTAVALVHAARLDAFQELLLAKVRKLRVGDPFESVFMGPLIGEPAHANFLAALGEAERQGVETLLAAGTQNGALRGAYVTPSVHRFEAPRGLAYESEELFGPDLALTPIGDLEEAIAHANRSPYGLSVSVFSRSAVAFERAFEGLRYGCINWNSPTCGASGRLPFGGTRKSGNHRPAALFSTLYCSYPVASLRGAAELDPSTLSPGFEW